MSGSLQQNVIDTTINEWTKRLRACVRPDRKHFEHLLELLIRLKKSRTNEVWFTSFIPPQDVPLRLHLWFSGS